MRKYLLKVCASCVGIVATGIVTVAYLYLAVTFQGRGFQDQDGLVAGLVVWTLIIAYVVVIYEIVKWGTKRALSSLMAADLLKVCASCVGIVATGIATVAYLYLAAEFPEGRGIQDQGVAGLVGWTLAITYVVVVYEVIKWGTKKALSSLMAADHAEQGQKASG